MLMAVVNDAGVVDGSCAAIASGDMAVSRGVLGCVSRVCLAVSVVLGVAWVLESTGAAAGVVWVYSST
jgi:hypothetical protein